MAGMDAEFSESFKSDYQDVFQSMKWQGLAMYHILESKFQAWKPHSFWFNLGKRQSLCEEWWFAVFPHWTDGKQLPKIFPAGVKGISLYLHYKQ